MNLEQWKELPEEKRLSASQETVISMARLAAQKLLEEGHWNAESIYISDRFGETYFRVYIDDEKYIEPYPNREYLFYGFRLEFEPVRRKLPGLDMYRNEFYFS